MVSFELLGVSGLEWIGVGVLGLVGLWAVVGREVWLVLSLIALILMLTRVG